MAAAGAHVLMLVSDAYGGFGGISQYNRDLISAMSSLDEIARIEAVPRIAKDPVGPLPEKLDFDLSGRSGKVAYAVAALRRGLLGPRPDYLICGHLNLLPLASLIARARGTRLLLQLHGIDAWTAHPGKLVRRLTASVDVVLSVSAVTAGRYLAWARPPRIGTHVIPNTIQPDHYGTGPKSADLVEAFGLEGRTVLMTMGRMAGRERYKGFDRTIEAMPRIAQEIPNVTYVIAGTGDDIVRLRAKAAEYGVADRVVFTGFVPEERKADYFRLADVFLMPSMGEGFGIVCLEALACGVPTIGSVADGTIEALRAGTLGILVNPLEPEEIVAAVIASLAKPREVPAGLDYFAFPSFRRRVHDLLFGHESLLAGSRATDDSAGGTATAPDLPEPQ